MVQLFGQRASIEKQIESAQQKLGEIQSAITDQSAATAAEQAKLEDLEETLKAATASLQTLLQRQSRQQEEAKLAESQKKMRPIADRINRLQNELADAIADFEEAAKDVPSKDQRHIELNYKRRQLPVVIHQEGHVFFKLLSWEKARNEPESLRRGIVQ